MADRVDPLATKENIPEPSQVFSIYSHFKQLRHNEDGFTSCAAYSGAQQITLFMH